MARYKIVDRSPRFLPVVLEAQLMSGSFEYALDYLIDQQLDLSRLDRRSHNDATVAYATPIKHPHGKWHSSINSKPRHCPTPSA